jgi:hypothetical protein
LPKSQSLALFYICFSEKNNHELPPSARLGKWHTLLKEKLIPSLLLMEKDFISNNIDFVSFNKSDDAGKLPSNLDILERVNFLYELLGKT